MDKHALCMTVWMGVFCLALTGFGVGWTLPSLPRPVALHSICMAATPSRR